MFILINMTRIAQLNRMGEKLSQRLPTVLSRAEVGKVLSISGERVRQIEMLALAKVELRMKEQMKFLKNNDVI